MPTRPRSISFAPPGAIGRTEAQKAAKRFYDSKRWKDLRRQVIRQEPLCQLCPVESRQLATTGHHVKDLLTHPHLALVRENILSSCTACHAALHKGRQLAGGLRVPTDALARGEG